MSPPVVPEPVADASAQPTRRRGRAPKAAVVAAVLLYRFLTVVPTLVLGLISAGTWKHYHPQKKDALAAGLD